MKRITVLILLLFYGLEIYPQQKGINHDKIREDLNEILSDISKHYIYLEEKKVDLDCLKTYYEQQIPTLQTEEDIVLFFEYLLDEFYDSHVILNTNRASSFRLYAPVYATLGKDRFFISTIWQSQIESIDPNVIGAEIIQINGVAIHTAIEDFPTHCNDKSNAVVREWIVNKILAGRYNQPRIITLKTKEGSTLELDLDQVAMKKNAGLLTSRIENGIGIIRIHNSLGNNDLVHAFDEVLDGLMDTKGLIVDLRNTVGGGNTYVARGIMSRFMEESNPYQKHWATEQFGDNPEIERSWVEWVSPRGKTYTAPVVILVGRWTGSMGEGLAIGFEGIGRAKIVGTEMERLAGEMYGFSFRHQNFGYRLSTAKLYHVNGTAREKYVPEHYVKQMGIEEDETLKKGLGLIRQMKK